MERLLTMLEEATQSAPGTLAPEVELSGLDGWDSMGMVMFLGMLVEERGTELSVHELRSCATVAQLAALVERAPAG